jgi:hypothetical protein
MSVETKFFNYLAPVFVIFAIAYGIMTDWEEEVGLAGLLLLAAMVLLIGGYLAYTARHIDPRPEDDPYGEIEQGAGELGEFAPYSWWPLVAAAAGAIVFAGAAIGPWLMLMGVGLGVVGVCGWVFEFYRGERAH